VAARAVGQGAAGCGGFQRKAPTGGAAKGTPRKARTAVFNWNTPTTSPVSIWIRVPADSAWVPATPAISSPTNAPEWISRIRTSRYVPALGGFFRPARGGWAVTIVSERCGDNDQNGRQS
jgi:hypothetical protein